MIKKRKTRVVNIGGVKIGGNSPIVVQSMCNTDTRNIKATVKQIKQLEKAGCEMIRVAVVDMKAAQSIRDIKKKINIPLIADIHFDYRLAVECAKQGADKLRFNPGNINSEKKIKAVVDVAKKNKLPIRIGVNSGSLEKDILKKYKGRVTPEAMVESALKNIKILEKYNFYDMVISLKASDVARTVEAYKILAGKVYYPLHIGITEAGTAWSGTIKSAVGIGSLLSQGIGDTIRVSLTADPVEEVKVGWEILKSLGLRRRGVEIISCPTCGRTEIDVIRLAKEVEEKTLHVKKPLRIAVMGCVVNGPGEAKEADIGVAGGRGVGVIFKKGAVVKTVKENEIVSELSKEIKKLEL
jgi:(E)-4-hydroxy-3-methylbut-2-enyl-diphosphate synthase